MGDERSKKEEEDEASISHLLSLPSSIILLCNINV